MVPCVLMSIYSLVRERDVKFPCGRSILLSLILVLPFLAFAGAPDPGASHPVGPPDTNPHPPITALDKKRVAFAELAIRKLLMTPLSRPGLVPKNPYLTGKEDFNLTESCLKDSACLLKNQALTDYLDATKYLYGVLTEMRHVHIIPWSMEKYLKNKTEKAASAKKVDAEMKIQDDNDDDSAVMQNMAPVQKDDEYMFHVYVQGMYGKFFHLDVFVAEDDKGNLLFRRFFLTPLDTGAGTLPIGVDC